MSILKNLPETIDFIPLTAALKLCQNHNMVSDAFEIYELIIESPNSPPSSKKEMYDNYANHLVHWGLLDKAKSLLFDKIRFAGLDME